MHMNLSLVSLDFELKLAEQLADPLELFAGLAAIRT